MYTDTLQYTFLRIRSVLSLMMTKFSTKNANIPVIKNKELLFVVVNQSKITDFISYKKWQDSIGSGCAKYFNKNQYFGTFWSEKLKSSGRLTATCMWKGVLIFLIGVSVLLFFSLLTKKKQVHFVKVTTIQFFEILAFEYLQLLT